MKVNLKHVYEVAQPMLHPYTYETLLLEIELQPSRS